MNFTAAAEGSIIYLENVTVDFDGFKALHDLNFFMDYRELRVVIGPNGAGKTTLLDVISGKVQPAALFLGDEPVAGMTDEETARTAELLQSVARERAVLVIEHDMEFVRSLARKVTVLHEGSVLCEGSVDEIQQDERVREVYLGRNRSRTVAAHA